MHSPTDFPFEPVNLTVDYVDSVAGSLKTRTAVANAVKAAKGGRKTIFAMPTLKLIAEMSGYAYEVNPKANVVTITSEDSDNVVGDICDHLEEANYGHVLFITHAGLTLVLDWPERAREYHLIIDEVIEVILSRAPFKLRYSGYALTSFLEVTKIDDPEYYRVMPKPDYESDNEFWRTELRAKNAEKDDVYKLLEPIPRWVVQGAPLFTDIARWENTVNPPEGKRQWNSGVLTICGFRRPDLLTNFAHVTVMSALFRYTMLHAVWTRLGINFVPSSEIKLTKRVTSLGRRKLRIYWLTDQGWSKKARDKAGGIRRVLQLIKDKEVIDPKQSVCVVVNKDDGSESDPSVVKEVFPNGMILPHDTRGRNNYQDNHQIIYCAALNSYTPDIRWIEKVLEIDSYNQRIGRLGQAVYQSSMRLSLRNPRAQKDVTIVVIDKDVAEWLKQWFHGDVEVHEIDSTDVIRQRGKAGRPKKEHAMSAAERMRNMRARKRGD